MAHTAFDAQEISFVDQNLANEDLNQNRQQMESLRDKFALFLRDWTRNHAFIYRDQLISQLKVLTIDLEDLNAFDNELFRAIKRNPDDTLLQFEAGARKAFAHLHPEGTVVPEFQVSLHSSQLPISLRELHSDLIGRLLVIPGIIVSATKPQVKAKTVVAQCKGCQEKITIPVAKGFSGVQLPRNCNQRQRNEGVVQDKCPLDPYSILPDECQFTDQQLLRLQELVEHVPTGEMPRSVTVIVDRNLVDNVSPGNRVTIIGTFSVGAKGKRDIVRNSYLRVIGIMSEQQEEKRFLNFFSPEDEEKYHAMARDPEIYTKIAQSIAPSIYGNEDIKKAIACLLFGGSRKRLPDGVRLRGDINVLLLGDPSTAKSQFLKFVSRAAPIAVYTSGKGSSAAGLTASIIREGRGNEFKLEGGAMVLADGGVVCIDEFDKMRAQDRVAIHEAMEQQTISIAKAGITTILNSRVSVLAAANPSAGSYDDLKQAQEQIEFQSTILSRFDCIFLVRDQRNEEQDIKLAQHVIRLHMGGQMDLEEHADIELEDLKKYIAYTRAKCAPRLSEEAGKELQNFYVADRRKQRENTFPITVRQLEAIIRLSESIAKMSLSSIVTVQNVREAHRLFEVSTLNAASSGLSSSGAHLSPEMAKAVIDIEDYIRGHLSIGQNISVKTLEERLDSIFRNHRAIQHALHNMVRRQELKEKSNQRMLTRMEQQVQLGVKSYALLFSFSPILQTSPITLDFKN